VGGPVTASTDARLAADLAERAGDLLLRIRAGDGEAGRELGRIGDHQSNALILTALAGARPGDAVLSEESVDSPERLTARRVWIIDPLDGTREFSMAGRSDWAVHVALWEAGSGLTAGAVAEPALGLVHATDRVGELGAGLPVGTSRAGSTGGGLGGDGARRKPIILVSDSRPPAFAGEVAQAVGADVATMGSAGAKAMAVLRGDADAYLHAGGQWEWDSAAPAAVVTAAGLHASRIDGSPLVYNQPHPYLPDLLICRPDLAGDLLAAIALAV
jgi:3'(2'), 5'-bisphosphate nucleotidase